MVNDGIETKVGVREKVNDSTKATQWRMRDMVNVSTETTQ